MNVRRRDFLPLVTLVAAAAAAAATPAAGPAGEAAVPANSSVPQIAASIPDFSGIWVHPYFPGIEPPASGPGPVLNKTRRPDGTGNSGQFVGDYSNPALKAEAAQV